MKALITTALVLASSTAAFAAPSVVISGGASVKLGAGVTVRDYRSPATDDCGPAVVTTPVYHPVAVRAEPWFAPTNTRITSAGSVYTGSFGKGRLMVRRDAAWYRPQAWFALTEATRIDSNREFFNIQQSAGYFTKLQLKNLGGRTEIKQVAIEFKTARGLETQKVKLDSLMSASNPSLTINLAHDGRYIQRVIVYGESGRGSAYQLLAM